MHENNMPAGFFITGTDTDVGKTHVASQIIKAFAQSGVAVSGFKPVASGAEWSAGRWQNSDALSLLDAASVTLPYEVVNPYCFEPAIAPHIAAKQAGVTIDQQQITALYKQHEAASELVIVEGAGGWKVPLADELSFDDVALTLGLPVILVVGMKLGCINHALLTEEAILNKGCRLAGWVANSTTANFEQLQDNMDALKKRMQSPCIGAFSYKDSAENNTDLDQQNIISLLACLTEFR